MGVRRILLVGALVALAAPALLTGPALAAGPVEVLSERTQTSRLFDNGDGTFTLRQEIPAHYASQAIGWTTVHSTWPNTPHWQGMNTPDGRAAAGYNGWSPPTTVARSFFQFDVTALQGKQILSANLQLFGAFSAHCGSSAVSLRFTGPVHPDTTWNTQPPAYAAQERVEGGFCNGGRWIDFGVTGEVAHSAGLGWPTATFGVAAQNESDRYGWRKYGTANTGQAPTLSVTYQG